MKLTMNFNWKLFGILFVLLNILSFILQTVSPAVGKPIAALVMIPITLGMVANYLWHRMWVSADIEGALLPDSQYQGYSKRG